MKIILLGPPGAGKGTQAEFITHEYHVPHISTGELLRQNIRENTDLGRAAQGYMEKGNLVPDELIFGMIGSRLAEDDCEHGFLLDGFPRNEAQAMKLDEILGHGGVDIAIHIGCEPEELVARAVNRRVCKKCGATYNLLNRPSKDGSQCEKCGGDLFHRPDDVEETVMNRIAIYEQQTRPLVDFYERKGKLFKVNGNAPLEEVRAIIKERLNDLS